MADNYKELMERFYKLSGKLGGCCSQIKLARDRGDEASARAWEEKRILAEEALRRTNRELQLVKFGR